MPSPKPRPATSGYAPGGGVNVNVNVGVGLGLAVNDGVGVGCDADGVGTAGAEDVAERDGDGFALLGVADDGATGGGALLTAGWLAAGGTLGDIPALDPALAVTWPRRSRGRPCTKP